MARFTLPLAAILAIVLQAGPAIAQDQRPYKHPTLDMQFSAPHGWQHQPRPGDEGTHERVDPETGIHVLMWYTSTEQGAERYLIKMSSMMEIVPGADPKPRTIDGRRAWVLSAPAKMEGLTAYTLLAVIASGKSRLYPLEDNLYMVQVWCSAEDATRLAGRMKKLLKSVRITDRMIVSGNAYPLYPETTDSPADLPSPYTSTGGEVVVTVRTRDDRYGLVPVTVENGAPNDYANGEWDKGRQLAVDADDFPVLARTGLHAEEDLARTTSITGRPVAEITSIAKPGRDSTAGFIAEDEDILAVIRGDNRVVDRLGLTHPRLARPLFEIFNLVLRDLELFRRGRLPANNIATLFYNGHEIRIEARASKGWQESIFSDEVRGYWSIAIRRELTIGEKYYLRRQYGDLEPEELAVLKEKLTSIHTGEMVPFYVTRYGFYEGHTGYRADPIAIANLFGLAGIEEIDAAMGGDLLGALTRHYRPGVTGD